MIYPVISVIIPTHNRKEMLLRLLNSVFDSNYPLDKIEVIVVDDASTDGTVGLIRTSFSGGKIKVITNQQNQQVSACRNTGIKAAAGEYLFFLDDDTLLRKETIKNLVLFLQKHPGSLIGPVILQSEEKDRIWSMGVKINPWTGYGTFLNAGRIDACLPKEAFECDAIPTAFMANRQIIERVGYFNKDLFPTAFEEFDFCIRAKFSGSRIFILPAAKIYHERLRGAHFDNPRNLYFGSRNRIISLKLWSRDYLHFLTSRVSAICLVFMFIALKLFVYRKNSAECIKGILKGLWEGLMMSKDIESYIDILKTGESIRYQPANPT